MRVTLILSTDPIIDNLERIKEYVIRSSESLDDWVDCPAECLPDKISSAIDSAVERYIAEGVRDWESYPDQYRDFKIIIQHFTILLNSMKMKSQWVKGVKLLPETLLLEIEVEL